jgi:hypothetical protein
MPLDFEAAWQLDRVGNGRTWLDDAVTKWRLSKT